MLRMLSNMPMNCAWRRSAGTTLLARPGLAPRHSILCRAHVLPILGDRSAAAKAAIFTGLYATAAGLLLAVAPVTTFGKRHAGYRYPWAYASPTSSACMTDHFIIATRMPLPHFQYPISGRSYLR